MFSPRTFDRLFRPFMQQYFDLAHKYGARAMMHSCGSVREVPLPDFERSLVVIITSNGG